MSNLLRPLVLMLLSGFGLLLPSTALAVTGTVTGKFVLYVNQGQFCDTTIGMNCTHARFLRANNTQVSGVYQPIMEARVELKDEAGAIIGHSSTDAQGQFSITWTRATTPTSAVVRWAYYHVDGRFWVASAANPDYAFRSETTSFTVVANGNKALGNIQFGDMEIRQAYHSAERAWYEAFRYSGAGVNTFYSVRIIPNHPDVGLDGGFIDQVPSNRQVKLGANSTRYPISVVHHEMGHMFYHLAQPAWKGTGYYNYPTACTAANPSGCAGGNHSVNSAEWKMASWLEGIASFLGTVPSYWYDSPQPQWCYGTVNACGNTGFNQEVRSGACAADEGRWELSVQRNLWDIYDSVNDAAYDDSIGANTSNTLYGFGALTGHLASYGAGIGNGEANEPWSTTALTTISPTKHDERATADYYTKLNNANTNPQRSNNCSP